MRLSHYFSCLALTVVLGLAAGRLHADTPPPLDPTLSGSAPGVYLVPTVTSPEDWELIEACILAVYPDASYDTICWYALSWFNALPPDYSGSTTTCPTLCPLASPAAPTSCPLPPAP